MFLIRTCLNRNFELSLHKLLMNMRLALLSILLISALGLKAQDGKGTSQQSDGKKGVASFYHDKFEGRKTATGEVFDNDKFTAACNKLKLGLTLRLPTLITARLFMYVSMTVWLQEISA